MKPEKTMSRANYIALSITGVAIFFGVWWALAASGLVRSFFLPSPRTVAVTGWELFMVGGLVGDVAASVYRITISCLISLIIAVPLGLALGLSERVEAACEPILAFIRYIPPSAFVPLAIIWFGIGDVQKTAILFLAVAPYLALLIADHVASVRRELIEAALTLGASPWAVVMRVVIPHTLPGMWDSLRIMIGAAWSFVIIAEIVGATNGLGHLMVESQRFLRTDKIFAGIVVIGFLGLATDYFFKITYYTLFPWTEKSHARTL